MSRIVKAEMDVANWIQTAAEFSCATAVMDRIGGWIEGGRNEDGSQIGGRLAARLWINWACARVQENHEWISEFSSVVQENKFWRH